MTFDLPQNVSQILKTITNAGYEAYIVGGCVRDMLLCVTPFDFDITTSASPEIIKSLFEKTVDTGIRHGTVTVISGGSSFEVTTFRTDGDYKDSRHPEKVKFVSNIKEDLSRRDFTVNAMAYNDKAGLVDYFGGREDLKAKILKTVGDPSKRFSEDALRILRLFRFSSTLGFAIDKTALESALALSESLSKISAERIAAELKKAVCGKNVNALSPLIKSGGLGAFGITKAAFSNIERLPQKRLKLFAFLYEGAEDPTAAAKKLKLSSKEIKYIEDMAFLLGKKMPVNAAEIKFLLKDYDACFEDYLAYKSIVEGLDTKAVEKIYKSITKNKEPYKISHLAISGDDLLKRGFKSGADIGKALERLLKAVVENPEKNTRETLLSLIK